MKQLHLVLQAYRVAGDDDDLSFATIPLTADTVHWLSQLPTAYATAKARLHPPNDPRYRAPTNSFELDAISVTLVHAQFWTCSAHDLAAVDFDYAATRHWSLRWLDTDAMLASPATADSADEEASAEVSCQLELPHLMYDWAGDIYLRGYTADGDEYVLTEDAPLTAVLAAYHRLKDLPAGCWFQLDQIHACATLPADRQEETTP